jgi:plastocyanin
VNEKASIWIKAALVLGLAIVAVVIAVVALDDSDDDGGEVAATEEDAGDGAETDPEAPVEIPDDAEDLTGQATVEISVTDNLFEPGTILVSPGTEVVWTNEGRNDHNVKPDDPVTFETIPTDELGREMSAGRTFADPGAFAYYCSIHGAPGVGQFGAIIVT